MIVDVHTHLTHEDFRNNLDEVIRRAEKVGVKHVISNGTNLEDNRKVMELSKRYEMIEPALGLY